MSRFTPCLTVSNVLLTNELAGADLVFLYSFTVYVIKDLVPDMTQ